MSTIYEKTDNYQLDLYGNNDPADLRDGYNNSMRTIDATLGTHLNRIEGMEARETHDEEVVKALLGDNTVDSATSAKTKWNKAVTDATSADSRLTSIEKIIYVNQYASTEEKDNTYGRVRFRNSIIKVTKGIVEIQ